MQEMGRMSRSELCLLLQVGDWTSVSCVGGCHCVQGLLASRTLPNNAAWSLCKLCYYLTFRSCEVEARSVNSNPSSSFRIIFMRTVTSSSSNNKAETCSARWRIRTSQQVEHTRTKLLDAVTGWRKHGQVIRMVYIHYYFTLCTRLLVVCEWGSCVWTRRIAEFFRFKQTASNVYA